mgnify:CR=1 FL=1
MAKYAPYSRSGVTHGRRTSTTHSSTRFGGAGGWQTRGSISGKGQIVNFSVSMNDVEVQHALQQLDRDMPHVILDVLEESMEEVADDIRDHLMSMNTASGGAQEVIANSIRVSNNGESVRIFSSPFPGGVEGSRGVKLAQLYIEGSSPFLYGFELPPLPNQQIAIAPSRQWEAKGSPTKWFNIRKHPIHPGFGEWQPNERKTYDWVKTAESWIMDNFEHDLRTMIDNAYGGGGHY